MEARSVAELGRSATRTDGIAVAVRCEHLDGQENPDLQRYVFVYHISIRNDGDAPVTLVARHWDIIDGNGAHETVDGPGVVGKMPHLEPGETFSYSSFCPLPTHWGTMEGHYVMERGDGDRFKVPVDRFHLIAESF